MRGSEPMPDADLLDVGAHALGEVGHLVHEADLGGQHGVGRVLGQLGRAHVHHDHAVAVADERVVQRLEQLGGARVVGADDDAVRLHEVVDRRAFLQELGVGDDIELDLYAALAQGLVDALADLVRRAHRHRRLVDDDPVLVRVAADGLGHGQDVREVGRTVLLGRGADRDELEQAVTDALFGVGRELEAPLVEVALDQHVEPGLVDRDVALLQPRDLAGVDVDADDVVAGLGEAGAGDQADVTRTEDW